MLSRARVGRVDGSDVRGGPGASRIDHMQREKEYVGRVPKIHCWRSTMSEDGAVWQVLLLNAFELFEAAGTRESARVGRSGRRVHGPRAPRGPGAPEGSPTIAIARSWLLGAGSLPDSHDP